MRKLVIALLFVALTGLGLLWGAVHFVEEWSTHTRFVATDIQVELRPRTSLSQLSRQLEERGIVDQGTLFHIWMKLTGGYAQFQAGTYQFSGEVTPQLIREKMLKGDVYVPLVLQVAIPEGFTLRLLNERLATKGVAQMKDLNKLVTDKSFLMELGVPSTSLEGFTYPATYNFEKLPTAREVYTKVVKTFFEKLPENYVERIKEKKLTLLQAVTFASLIELETMQESEKPMVSEVIWRRLKAGEALGIDAAIIYGIPNYQGDITWAHLKDAKNPYNTRLHRGLPPTPIGAPSRSSLEAVLNPTNLGYYYYMLDATDRTHHVFSHTIKEHNIQVQRFLRAQKSESLNPATK